MTVRGTSLEAYHDIEHTLGAKQQVILKLLKRANRSVSNREISKELGVEINCVTGRVNELVKLGVVFAKEKRICRLGGRMSIHWQLTDRHKNKGA